MNILIYFLQNMVIIHYFDNIFIISVLFKIILVNEINYNFIIIYIYIFSKYINKIILKRSKFISKIKLDFADYILIENIYLKQF